ncbi:MAG: zf-HC2 domain-containing protein, partial [Candidatus Omnitrophica bacterium]|nr:zf-HC2 domain-containing protein [Candidatus Omnitrophota bacterium]
MNCKKVKKLILTDYIDNEIDIKLKDTIDKHLIACKDCFNFKNDLEKKLSILKTAKQITAPDFLWYRFKEKIKVQEKRKLFPLLDFSFKKFIIKTIPITIGISVLAFALFLKSNVAKRTQLLYEYVAQQIDFLTTLT